MWTFRVCHPTTTVGCCYQISFVEKRYYYVLLLVELLLVEADHNHHSHFAVVAVVVLHNKQLGHNSKAQSEMTINFLIIKCVINQLNQLLNVSHLQ